MPPFELRPACDADADFLCRLYAATREQELAPAGWPQAVLQDFLRSQFTLRRAQYHAGYPTARDDIVLVGGAQAGHQLVKRGSSAWRVVDIALLPQYQGHGVATALLQKLQRDAAAVDCALELQIESANPAQRLYRRLGFVAEPGDGVYLPMRWHPTPRPAAGLVEAHSLESLS